MSDAPQIKAGQIWKEVDPRLERLVRIIQVGEPTSSLPGFVQIECVLMGPTGWQRKSRTGVTRARASRFNGKRGGYALHEDVP